MRDSGLAEVPGERALHLKPEEGGRVRFRTCQMFIALLCSATGNRSFEKTAKGSYSEEGKVQLSPEGHLVHKMLPCVPGSSCSMDAVGLFVCLPSPSESFQEAGPVPAEPFFTLCLQRWVPSGP